MKNRLKALKKLRALINRYNWEYFTLNQPSISDKEFDRLFEQLKILEEENPEYSDPNSPIHKIGSDLLQNFPEEKHVFPMLSLNKVYNKQDLVKWLDKLGVNVCVEQKLDGVSLVLHYQEGRLIKALSRGDGSIGSLITDNVRTIADIPLILEEEVNVIVRGEAYLKKSDFHRLNEVNETKFANPRNFTAGTLRRLKSSEVARIPLRFLAYEAYWEKDLKIQTHKQSLELLAQLRFPVSHLIGFFGDLAQPLTQQQRRWGWVCGDTVPLTTRWSDLGTFIEEQQKEREILDYEIDGLVIKVNDLALREAMGNTAHHPRWAVALKFDYQEGQTRLKDIVVQIGRTGRATPLALVEPLELTGVCISRITLHNQAYISELALKTGDIISVSRRGDVIPAVERVVQSVKAPVWQMPTNCPVCGEILILEGAHHFCPNKACPARLKAQLYYFVGRKQMDIQTLSHKTIDLLFDKGLIREEADLYSLKAYQIEGLDGMGQKRVEQLQASIEKSKKQPFERVMRSLGLKEIGPALIELLHLAGYSSFDDYVRLAQDPLVEEKLRSIKGIGAKLAQSFPALILEPNLQRKVETLRKVGLNFTSSSHSFVTEEIKGPFLNQVWCVTGSFKNFNNREEIHNLIKSLGGLVATHIDKKVTHLLVGEKAGSKREQATHFSIICLGEEEFMSKLKKARKGRQESC